LAEATYRRTDTSFDYTRPFSVLYRGCCVRGLLIAKSTRIP
jgi:hypothetical protein